MDKKKDIVTYLNERTKYVEELIEECGELKKEWEERIAEAMQARDNYRYLIRNFVNNNNTYKDEFYS